MNSWSVENDSSSGGSFSSASSHRVSLKLLPSHTAAASLALLSRGIISVPTWTTMANLMAASHPLQWGPRDEDRMSNKDEEGKSQFEERTRVEGKSHLKTTTRYPMPSLSTAFCSYPPNCWIHDRSRIWEPSNLRWHWRQKVAFTTASWRRRNKNEGRHVSGVETRRKTHPLLTWRINVSSATTGNPLKLLSSSFSSSSHTLRVTRTTWPVMGLAWRARGSPTDSLEMAGNLREGERGQKRECQQGGGDLPAKA